MATTASGIEAARELDELYREHAAEIFRYTYAVLGNRADAEDVTQTTFVNALRALERGERPRTPKNWLITIAHNLIRQRFRQQQARPREVELDHELPAAEADDDVPSLDDLVRALQRIPPTQRQALVLRELEGRSYVEIAALLDVSQSALETLIFRARRSLAEELENLVTCDGAELALSRESDGRLGRKERRRLLAHLDECESCARIAARSMKHRRAFKVLAVLPLPFSLTLFKGAPTASAAAGLPTIGAAGAAAGVGAAGVSAKVAIGLAAVAVAGGAGYEGGQALADRVAPAAAAKTSEVKVAPIMRPVAPARVTPFVVPATPLLFGPETKPAPPEPTRSASAGRGRSAAAPGHNKTAEKAVRAMPPPARKPAAKEKAKETTKVKAKATATEKAAPVRSAATPERGKSSAAPGRLPTPPRAAKSRVTTPAKTKAEKPRLAKQPQSGAPAGKAEKAKTTKTAATADTADKPAKAEKTEKPELLRRPDAVASRDGGDGADPSAARPAP